MLQAALQSGFLEEQPNNLFAAAAEDTVTRISLSVVDAAFAEALHAYGDISQTLLGVDSSNWGPEK